MTNEDFCRGCGYYHAVHGVHREDCTRGLGRSVKKEKFIPVEAIYGDTCRCGRFLARHDSGLCEWCTPR